RLLRAHDFDQRLDRQSRSGQLRSGQARRSRPFEADRHGHGKIRRDFEGGRETTGQIFGVRNNEIYLFSQPRPIRTAHTAEGWTPETILERVLPSFQASYFPLVKSNEVFTWDPV